MSRLPVILGVFLFLVLHMILSLDAAWRKSPVWDEIVYPAAGYDLLHTGRLHMNLDHPPLGKALLALSLLPFHREISYSAPSSPGVDAFKYGFQFTYENRFSPRLLTYIPRLIALAFSAALAVLIFIFVRRRWGDGGALLAVGIYCLSPAIIARASLALLEMPLVFFMTATWMGFLRWLDKPSSRRLAHWTILWSLALLVKSTALVLFPALILSALALHSTDPTHTRRLIARTFLGLALALLFSEGIMRCLGASYFGTQWAGPDTAFFLKKVPVYFHGQTFETARWYFGLVAWLIKMPIAVLALAGWGLARWVIKRPQDPALGLLLGLGLTGLFLMLAMRSIIATTHYFFLYPVMAVMASPAALEISTHNRRIAMTLLVCWLLVSSLCNHPDHLAYFNELSGGTGNGYTWLADSDQDWGQDLGTVSQWMRENKVPAVLLAYSGAGDPRAYGIRYQDVLSPALVTRTYRGEIVQEWPNGLYLAVGTKVLQSEKFWMGWLESNRQPVARLGGTLFVYDLTRDSDALNWLISLYQQTGRPAHAETLRRAVSLSGNQPTHPGP